MIDKLKAYGWMIAAIALGLVAGAQTIRLNGAERAHDKLKIEVAEAERGRTEAALKATQDDAAKKMAHAAATQENVDEFTTSQPVRDAIARADLARVERLRLGAEQRAATYRAQAAANAAACRDLADRLEAFDRQLVAGVGVVADLRSALERRDAEVVLLHKQLMTERTLTAEAPG